MTTPNVRSPVAFLWNEGVAPLPAPGGQPRQHVWWEQFSKGLRLTAAAREELEKSSREVLALMPDPADWREMPSPTKGLVVGAVQSGKTAHMMALTARALDQGYRIVVVLAGGKDDLRTQTARLFNTQLLLRSDPIPNSTSLTLAPERARGAIPVFAPPYSVDSHQYALLRIKLFQALERGEPAVVVIKKNTASLGNLAARLAAAYDKFGVVALPTLILDDECDQASVDEGDRAIPEAIASLWQLPKNMPNTCCVGYTATAAANLLQESSNELYPEQFAYLLRYPAREETALSFAEREPDSWYTGGRAFFDEWGEAPSLVENFLLSMTIQESDLTHPVESNPSLLSAVRAYFVAGAFRLAIKDGWSFTDPLLIPQPHSMLIQTSPSMSEHERWAAGVSLAFGGSTLPGGVIRLSVETVLQDMARHPALWRASFDSFAASRERIYNDRPHPGVQRSATWDAVRALVPVVVEQCRVKVVNSDPNQAITLDFASRVSSAGVPEPPQDVFVIVIGGSKLSRGITIEGLCISYFCRWTPSPTEDTVLQISRWFGYRGPYLDYCRLVTTNQIAKALAEISGNDTNLRFQLAELMLEHKSPREAALVLRCNSSGLPTAKLGVGKVVDLAFSPVVMVFRRLEISSQADSNVAAAKRLVDAIKDRGGRLVLTGQGSKRGMLSRNWKLAEVASVLDELSYEFHNPDEQAAAPQEFYRKSAKLRQAVTGLDASEDPYQVAAYLKMWGSLAQERGDDAPLFNVGVAYGELAEETTPFTFPLLNRRITASGVLESSWTGRSIAWRGDSFFDDPPADLVLVGSSYRKQGASGLLLMYIIHKNARGRDGSGLQRTNHSVTFGIVIPAGGPSFRRVTVKQS